MENYVMVRKIGIHIEPKSFTIDESSGRTYYCNKETNEVQWEQPEEFQMEFANPLKK